MTAGQSDPQETLDPVWLASRCTSGTNCICWHVTMWIIGEAHAKKILLGWRRRGHFNRIVCDEISGCKSSDQSNCSKQSSGHSDIVVRHPGHPTWRPMKKCRVIFSRNDHYDEFYRSDTAMCDLHGQYGVSPVRDLRDPSLCHMYMLP